MSKDTIVLGTRGSQLAMWQARRVKSFLEEAGASVALQQITTRGDQVQDVPLSEIGDEAVFTKEIDLALLRGDVDAAVHSLKDLPTTLPKGIELVAVSARAEPFDAFVAHPSVEGTLADLPDGATLATSSLRRRAQLKAWRADLQIVPVRGNVDTRLEKLDASTWHGMVLAAAGLQRMGLGGRIRQSIPAEIMVPAVGQGALALTCRSEDAGRQTLLRAAMHHTATGHAARAERAFLRRIGGGCRVPVGAWARAKDNGHLVIDGVIAALDGTDAFRGRREVAPQAAELAGAGLADELLAQGGAEIVSAILATR